MNRILLAALLMGFSGWCRADEVAPEPAPTNPSLNLTVDPNTPTAITRIASTYHVLDNLTPLTFYDFNNGIWCAGGVTTLYKKYYSSADVGMAVPMTTGAKGEFAGGVRFYLGELAMDKISGLRSFTDANGLTAGLLKYMAAGIMASYNWSAVENEKPWRVGPYVGFEIHIQ